MSFAYCIAKLVKKLHIPAIRDSKLHHSAVVCSGSHVRNTSVGRYTYLGNFCTVIHADVAAFSSIADNCVIGGASHPYDWASTSPVFHAGKNVLGRNFSNHLFDPFVRTAIGNDVWIGNNTIVKGGVTIGDGSVIGMGSVVTKDVPPFEVWAGNPARYLRKRFDPETCLALQEMQWWNWEDNVLESASAHFDDVHALIASHAEHKGI